MDVNTNDFRKLSDFEDILIVDEKGDILYFDFPDLSVLKTLRMKPDEMLGKKVTSLYKNVTEENSTIMKVLKTGIPICHNKQKLISKKNNNSIFSINSTYPLLEKGNIIGAIEFSKRIYTRETIQLLKNYSYHKIYRNNNTIYTIDDIITVNPKMLEIKNKIAKTAKTDSSVFIFGRTGAGKEVVAQAIHNLSERFHRPFISQNCGAIPSTLLESTLFGTVKGSFTGSEDMKGLFEQAEGGTLFLDEVNSLDYNLQVKLLKAIEEKTIKRVGGTKNIDLDIRIISATNEDPEKMVADKRLREDLFYRLGVVQINLPNLSERMDDIKGLVDYFISFYNDNMNIQVSGIQPQVMDYFYKYNWPGNIRELKNAIEMAFNNVSSEEITLQDIPERIGKGFGAELKTEKSDHSKSLKHCLEAYEKNIIMREFTNSNERIAETARRLGISKQLLKYKMNKYNIVKKILL